MRDFVRLPVVHLTFFDYRLDNEVKLNARNFAPCKF